MIKNKYKLGLVALSVLMVFGMATFANAQALIWGADQTVDLSSPDVNLTIVSGSRATSLVVNTGSIAIVVPNGDSFTIITKMDDKAVPV